MGQMYKAEVQCQSVDIAEGFPVSVTPRLCAQTETKSLQTFLLLGSEHFQMCHSVDVNELVHLT